MPYQILSAGPAVFVVWGRPEIDDVVAIGAEIARVATAMGAPITFITRVPATAEAPSAAVQKVVNQQVSAMLDRMLSYHVVLEGQGFVAAAKRSVLALMFMAAGRRGMFFVHSRADEVLTRVKPEARAAVADLLRAAAAAGLLTCPPPTTSPAREPSAETA